MKSNHTAKSIRVRKWTDIKVKVAQPCCKKIKIKKKFRKCWRKKIRIVQKFFFTRLNFHIYFFFLSFLLKTAHVLEKIMIFFHVPKIIRIFWIKMRFSEVGNLKDRKFWTLFLLALMQSEMVLHAAFSGFLSSHCSILVG